MKISSSVAIWIAVFATLIVIEILEIDGVISYQLIMGNIFFFVFAMVGISLLAIIGAIFVGILLSKRIYVNSQSLFEIEMLKMRDDVAQIKRTVDEIKAERK